MNFTYHLAYYFDGANDGLVGETSALIGLRTEGIEIADPMCCKKTFEEYFDVLEKLCAD